MSLDPHPGVSTPLAPAPARRKSIDLALVELVLDLSRNTGFCWASNTFLAAKLGVIERTIQLGLARASKRQEVRIEHPPGDARRIWPLLASGEVAPPVAPKKRENNSERESQNTHRTVCGFARQYPVENDVQQLMREWMDATDAALNREEKEIPPLPPLPEITPRMNSWTPAPTPTPPAAQAQEDPQVFKLTARGVPQCKARDLVRRHPPERIDANLRYGFDRGLM